MLKVDSVMHRFWLLGTDVDRHGPVQKDDHGAFRSTTGLITFCGRFLHFPLPLSNLASLSLEDRVIAFDDSDSFEDTCTILQQRIAGISFIDLV